ncbi:MAG: hypothetical protein J6T99_05560 [Oscillospiraceae bacterium]|nr:hypothetical protein [Oscillospiraceae bacterium]
MIRTNVVKLNSIKGIAFRQKLLSGGSGIVIMREDSAQPGIASISKTSGDPILTANTSKKLFPLEAFKEAISLTAGMPYRKQGKVQLKGELPAEEPVTEEQVEEEVVVDSAEYEKIVEKYTDKNGRLSYELLNKDMIKFAHSSSKVRKMVEDGESVEAIRLYAVGTKFRNVAGNPDLTDKQVLKMVDLLDEVSPKGVFKEFNDELRKMKAAAK